MSVEQPDPLPSPEQIRAARAWLRLTQEEFGAATGIPKRTLVRLELADTLPYDDTLRKVRDALVALGVELLFDGGMPTGIRVARGSGIERRTRPATRNASGR